MRIIFSVILNFIYLNIIYSQGVDFPDEPEQAPISGLVPLVATGIGLEYKK